VTQSLGQESLLGVLVPPSIVVVLLILSWNVGLSVVVLVGCILISDFVDERLNKLYEVPGVDLGDQSLIQVINNELADEYRLEVLLHHFQLIRTRRNLFGKLSDVLCVVCLIEALESVAHGTLGKGLIGNSNLAAN
jgi:hypothetical protein